MDGDNKKLLKLSQKPLVSNHRLSTEDGMELVVKSPKIIDSLRWSMCSYNIRYWLPDHPTILAPDFVLQKLDIPPEFPELLRFLDYWTRNIEGKLHSVIVMHERLTKPKEMNFADLELKLH